MTSDTLPYSVPREPGAAKAVILAVLVHAVLFAFLWVGINWVNEAPQSIDPDYVFTQPELDNTPPPEPVPVPTPKVEDQTPPVPDPDIATAQEKKRLKEEQEEKDKIAAQKKLEEQKAEEEEKRKEAQEEADKKKREEDEKKRQDDLKKKAEADADKKLQQKLRDDERARITREAGGSPGAPTTPGKPSGGGQGNAAWIGKVQSKIKSLIIFNPPPGADPDATAQFSVSLLPDGSIGGPVRLTKSSGNSAWDDAVKRAIENAAPYPTDSSGNVPRQFTSSNRLGDQK